MTFFIMRSPWTWLLRRTCQVSNDCGRRNRFIWQLTRGAQVVCFCLKSERQAVMATHGFILVLLLGWTVYQVSGKFSQCSDYSWYKNVFMFLRSPFKETHTSLFASAILSIRSLGQCVAAGFIDLAWHISDYCNVQRSVLNRKVTPKRWKLDA